MDKLQRTTTTTILILLLLCSILSLGILSAVAVTVAGQDVEGKATKPSLTELATSLFSSIAISSSTHGLTVWEKCKSSMNLVRIYFFPINHQQRDDGRPLAGGGELVKEAVARSSKMSKETVEGSARSAADVLGGAVHKTAETMKVFKKSITRNAERDPDDEEDL